MPGAAETLTIPYFLMGVSLLLLISVLASKASEWMGVPALLLFLVIGMLAGSEGPGGIWFDHAHAAQILGTLALAYIIFSGGLETNWPSVRPVLGAGILLATVGVLLTALLVGFFAVYLMGFSWLEGILLGSVMSSTDAAAVFSILRSRSVSLKGQLRPLLELESGSNDPMAVFLTVTVIGLVTNPGAQWWSVIPAFVSQMLVGAVCGILFGKIGAFLMNRLRLEYEGLYPVVTLALVSLILGVTGVLGGNGFLAVYLAGIQLGNEDFLLKRSVVRFHGGIAWLMQIAMFLTLGLLVFPSHLAPVTGWGLLLSLFLMLVARPVAVMICLVRSGFTVRERLLTSWVGLRGAAPIVLATFPLMAGVPRSEMIFNLVFFVVIVSVLFQGRFLPTMARWLGLNAPFDRRPRPPLEFEHTEPGIRADLAEVIVAPDSAAVGKHILELGLPSGLLMALIRRRGIYLVPAGQTALEANDIVLALGEPVAIEEVRRRFGRPDEKFPVKKEAGGATGRPPTRDEEGTMFSSVKGGNRMYPGLLAIWGALSRLKRTCPKCRRQQVVASEKRRATVPCRFCNADMPPAER